MFVHVEYGEYKVSIQRFLLLRHITACSHSEVFVHVEYKASPMHGLVLGDLF